MHFKSFTTLICCMYEVFEKLIEQPENEKVEYCMLAQTYNSDGFCLYEINSATPTFMEEYAVKDKELLNLFYEIKKKCPVALGLAREEMLVELYLDRNSFVQGYYSELRELLDDLPKFKLAKSLVDDWGVSEGQICHLFQDEDKKWFWLSEDFHLYEAVTSNFEILDRND